MVMKSDLFTSHHHSRHEFVLSMPYYRIVRVHWSAVQQTELLHSAAGKTLPTGSRDHSTYPITRTSSDSLHSGTEIPRPSTRTVKGLGFFSPTQTQGPPGGFSLDLSTRLLVKRRSKGRWGALDCLYHNHPEDEHCYKRALLTKTVEPKRRKI